MDFLQRVSDPRVLAVACRYRGCRGGAPGRPCVEQGVLAKGWHHSTRIVEYERSLSPEDRRRFRAAVAAS